MRRLEPPDPKDGGATPPSSSVVNRPGRAPQDPGEPRGQGWELHKVQKMLGHANISQTSTYLNATLSGLHESMRALDRKRNAEARKTRTSPACKPPAGKAACAPLVDRNDARQKDGKLLVN